MHGQRYELFSMRVEATRAGLGVALVPCFFVLNELRTGELAIPCELSLSNDNGYYLVYPESGQNSPLLAAFEEWLLAPHSGIARQACTRRKDDGRYIVVADRAA